MEDNHFDYSMLEPNDIIHFISFENKKMNCIITDVNWYDLIEQFIV